MRQLTTTKSTTTYRSTRDRRRPMAVETLESRRVLAANVTGPEFEIFSDFDRDGTIDYVCNGESCPDLDFGMVAPGEINRVAIGVTNIGDTTARKFNDNLEIVGVQVPDIFRAPSGGCLGFSQFPAGETCGLELVFEPNVNDPEGTVYGGNPALAVLNLGAHNATSVTPLTMGMTGSLAPASDPPTADAGVALFGHEDELLTFDASASTDPEGDPLTYFWDFGDGQTLQTSDPIVQHAYAFGGSFDVTLTVDDGNGNQSNDMTMATVAEVNDVPVADAGGPYSGFENISMTLDATNTSDFDNLDGTTANDQSLEYTWDFGDGTVVTTTAPTIDHTYTSAATYTVTLTVDDGSASSTPVQTTAVINTQPSGNPNDIYVWDIGFDQRNRGRHVDHFITVDVNRDSDADGLASSTDSGATGVTVTVELRGDNGFFQTFTGVTDENGLFRSGRIRNLAPGNYTAEVVDLAHQTLQWNHLLDPTVNDEDTDGDGQPDDLLVIP